MRSMMTVAMLVLSLSVARAQDKAQMRALKVIEELGGLYANDALALDARMVTDAHLKLLGGLPGLKVLSIKDNDKVTDAGIRDLVVFGKLEILQLDRTGITDAGMKHVAAIKSLDILTLRDTAVTDAGLKQLAALKRLRTLDLKGSKVTKEGVEALKKALPDCGISDP